MISRRFIRSAAFVVFAVAATLLALFAQHTPGRAHGRALGAVPHRAGQLAERSIQTQRPLPAPIAAATPQWTPAGSAERLVAASASPTFGQPTISGIQGNGFEEDLRLDPNDPTLVYTSAPAALSSLTSFIWRSTDAGKTFKWVPAAADKTGKPTVCPGGGDTELAVDTAHHLYFNDLTLVNFSTARSDNAGTTFLACSPTGVPDTLVDRQWYAVDGDPVGGTAAAPSSNSIYLANDEIGPGAPTCGSSTGNNVLVMYRSPLGGAPNPLAGIQFGPRNAVSALLSCKEGIMGNDEVSPVATTTGVGGATLGQAVRHVYVIHDDATFDHIFVGRCFPVAFGLAVANVSDPSGLNCEDLPVASFVGSKTGGNFPTIAIDGAGNLYAVWEQAPLTTTMTNTDVGDSHLMYSYSTNEGNSWSTPVPLPLGTNNNAVFAWIAAGDNGRVDIMFVGTDAHATSASCASGTTGGPDSVNGLWSLYILQSQNAHGTPPVFTGPFLTSQHHIHKGSIQTVLGAQCGDRTLGDFFQLRIGSQGEAEMSYADSNNIDEATAPHAMFVKQNDGPSVRTATPVVIGDAQPFNSVTDVANDGVYQALGSTSPTDPALDILSSGVTRPAQSACNPAGTPCYRATMTVTSLATPILPPTGDLDTNLVWSTQWLVPIAAPCTSGSALDACATGGKNYHVYAETTGGLSPAYTCWVGENAEELQGGGVTLTYPGTTQITGAGCAVNATTGTITIDVPISAVSLDSSATRLDPNRLFSVTASTMTMAAPAELPPPTPLGVGGQLFNLIDVAPGYDAVFQPTSVTVSSFAAKRTKGSVTVFWKTANETTVLGFNVFRTNAKGVTRKVNPSLVAAKRTGTAAGASYRLVDRSAAASKRSTYRLQVVDPAGTKSWYARRVSVR